MPRNIPSSALGNWEQTHHGKGLKATIFSNYILNNVSRHVYDEVGATGKQVTGVMVKGYGKKTISCRTILGTTVTSVNWSIEGRMARDSEWSEIYSFNATASLYLANTVNVIEEWDWIRVGAYINGGTNIDNPLITCTIDCRKRP